MRILKEGRNSKLGLYDENRGGEHLEFACVLKDKPTESTGRLDIGCDRERRAKGDFTA